MSAILWALLTFAALRIATVLGPRWRGALRQLLRPRTLLLAIGWFIAGFTLVLLGLMGISSFNASMATTVIPKALYVTFIWTLAASAIGYGPLMRRIRRTAPIV